MEWCGCLVGALASRKQWSDLAKKYKGATKAKRAEIFDEPLVAEQDRCASNMGEQGSGTALKIDRSTVTVLGCLFHSLEAEQQGGAIYVKSARLDVYDCTFLNCKGA